MRPISRSASPRLSPVHIPQFDSSSPRFSPVHIPKFDSFSPPMDAGDASSDDGDSLNTPLTEHHHHRLHSCDVYDQPHYSQDPYSSPEHYIDDEKANMCSPQYRCLPQRVPSVSPEHSQDLLFPTFPSPSSSTVTSPSYSTRTLDPTASPFTPTRQTIQSSSPVSSASPFLYPDASPSGSTLPSLPSLSLSNIGCDDMDDHPSLLLSPAHDSSLASPTRCEDSLLCKGRQYSALFHPEHMLNPYFVRNYRLEDELGAGGYGFVMTARHRSEGHEVAVKFIIKDKVPEHAWWEDEMFGRVPTEVMLLSLVNHDNIVRCLDLFEDEVYFYLVQELHGTPWVSKKQKNAKPTSAPGKLAVPTPSTTPTLSPSHSIDSTLDFAPHTPPHVPINAGGLAPASHGKLADISNSSVHDSLDAGLLKAPVEKPSFVRRASHDLFECIEQSKHKRLTENEARYIFAQVVEAVYYLDSQGITHCDIKDENLVVDSELKVKLIDFGSAVVADPTAPRPYYTLFFGTTAYASSEILLKKPYQAPPAEIWTLGVLLSYLLTGHSPFPTEQDAKDGRVVIREPKYGRLSRSSIMLMARCLEKDPLLRADIHEVRNHPWLDGALECLGRD